MNSSETMEQMLSVTWKWEHGECNRSKFNSYYTFILHSPKGLLWTPY